MEIPRRKLQEWHSLGEAEAAVVAPGLGDTTFLGEARACGVPVQKQIVPDFKGGGREGVWTCKK